VSIVVACSLLQVNELLGSSVGEDGLDKGPSSIQIATAIMQTFIFVKNVKVPEQFKHRICQSSTFVRISSERITSRQDLGLFCEGEEGVKSALFF